MIGGEHDRPDQPTVSKEYFLAVSRTIQHESTGLESFCNTLSLRHEIFKIPGSEAEHMLRDLPSTRKSLLDWYRHNIEDVVEILFMDQIRLLEDNCPHEKFESEPLILDISPRATPGVDLGGMTADEQAEHIRFLLGELLCHAISHRELLALESVVIRCLLTSVSQASRFAFFSIWFMIALRHSPQVLPSSTFLRLMCSSVSLARGSSSGIDEVEAGRVMCEADSSRLWAKVIEDLSRSRNTWKLPESFEEED